MGTPLQSCHDLLMQLMRRPAQGEQRIDVREQGGQITPSSSRSFWMRRAGITGALAGTSNVGKRLARPLLGADCASPRRTNSERTWPKRRPEDLASD